MIRWLLWTLRCRRGERCAHLNFEAVDPDAPAGAVVVCEYRCGGCGTSYRTTALVGSEGAFTQSGCVRAE